MASPPSCAQPSEGTTTTLRAKCRFRERVTAGPERRSPGTRERFRGARAGPAPRAPAGAFLRPPLPLRCPGPAMPRRLLILLLFLLLVPHLGRAVAPSAGSSAGNSAGNSTEPPRAAPRNETQSVWEREPGPRLSVGSGLPVLRRAVYVLSALSALAALYFMLRAVR